jgi:signal transduction histidine kinase/CheY-like chemotaxis protein/HAMP domain-containing protein
MIKSRLYWRVLSNFAFLLIILTALTILTLNILARIETNFNFATTDTRVLNDIEKVRLYTTDLPSLASEYALTSSPDSRIQFEAGWKEFDIALNQLQQDLTDSASIRDVRQMRSLMYNWGSYVGDKLIGIGATLRTGERSDSVYERIKDVTKLESQIQYLASARRIVRELYQKKVSTLPRNIDSATNLTGELRKFVILVNVLIAIFALALGFVLTRSITQPIGLLKQGTQNIMAGTFEPIELHRTDELGELAFNFNAMSRELGNNYTRLKAYSELVTTLNSLKSLDEVKTKSLQILCDHTHASVGALYLIDKESNMLDLVGGYALRKNGEMVKTFAMGEGIPGQCASEQRVLEIESIPANSGFTIDTGLVELIPGYIIAVPILFQDRILGVLVLGSANKFGDLQKEIINNSVPQLSVAITNALNDDATRTLSVEIARRNEELNGKNAELEKAYRVKSDFLSSMSHELRTPLNSIIGFSSVLLGPTGDPLTPDQRMALGKVLKNGQHLLQLINDILDLSKLESGRMTPNVESDDAASIVSSCTLIVEHLVKQKGLSLTQDLQPNLPTMTTDIVKVRQIIVNLLSNASKFTEKGEINIKVRESNGIVSFAVKDSGIGIEKKNYELVFEEFRQVDSSNTRKYKGTGLGLPIARKLARLLGGDLTVESEYGKGSTFTLAIPAVLPQQGQEPVKKAEPKSVKPMPTGPIAKPIEKMTNAATQGAQILCIDDDPDVIEILRKYLVPEGYSVVGALSGEEGLEAAVKVKPALITLDIMMPKMDGWQVLRELKNRSETKDIPVIIHSIVENKPLAISLGAVDLVTKPTEPKRLLSLVKQYCNTNDQYILIVDDHEDFALAFKALLGQDGFEVKVATGGKQALDILKDSTPALILLDLVMPGMDGFQVVRELQQNDRWKKIPVVILSGKELTKEEEALLDTHITDYLKKDSFSTTEISKTIKRILGSAH